MRAACVGPFVALALARAASAAPAAPLRADVARAAARFPDVSTLWSQSVVRTCGPNGGVCHNNRQYPDLQSLSGLLATVSADCNLLRTDATTIDNACEPRGDDLVIGAQRTRIGRIEIGPGTALRVRLRDRLTAPVRGRVAIERRSPGLSPLSVEIPGDAVRTLRAGDDFIVLDGEQLDRAPAPGGSLRRFLAPPAHSTARRDRVELGDPNGDGVFGAELGVALVQAGRPQDSYLMMRLLGALPLGAGHQATNTRAPPAREAQMPLANFDHWDAEASLAALWCWIGGGAGAGRIDYGRCDVSELPVAPQPRGQRVVFARLYETILQPRCAGPCHHPGAAKTTLDLSAPAARTWALLVGESGGGPSEVRTMPYVMPGDPERSYLWQKVSRDRPRVGGRMPLDGPLGADEIERLREWILQGARGD